MPTETITNKKTFNYARFGHENLIEEAERLEAVFFSSYGLIARQAIQCGKDFGIFRKRLCDQLGPKKGERAFNAWAQEKFGTFARQIKILSSLAPWYFSLSKYFRKLVNAQSIKYSWEVLAKLPLLSEALLQHVLKLPEAPKLSHLNELIELDSPSYFVPDKDMTPPYWGLAGKTLNIDDERLEALEKRTEELAQLDPEAINPETGEVRILQKHALEVLETYGYDVSALLKQVKPTRTQLLKQKNEKLERANDRLKNQVQELDAKSEQYQQKSDALVLVVERTRNKNLNLKEQIEIQDSRILELEALLLGKTSESANQPQESLKHPIRAALPPITPDYKIENVSNIEVPCLTEDFLNDSSVEVVPESNGIPAQTEAATNNIIDREQSVVIEEINSQPVITAAKDDVIATASNPESDHLVEVDLESNSTPVHTEDVVDNAGECEQPIISDSNSVLDETEEQLVIDALTEVVDCCESSEQSDTSTNDASNDEQPVVLDVVEAEAPTATLPCEASPHVGNTDEQLQSTSSNGCSEVQFSAVNQEQVQDKQQFKGKKVKVNKQSGVALEEIEMEKINKLCNHKRNKKSSKKSSQKKAFVVAGCR